MTAESDTIRARAKSMGVTTTLSGPMLISIAQVMATEALARAAYDNVAADRKIMEETCAAVVATLPATQTSTSLFSKLMAMLGVTPTTT